ncbi:MAG: metal ABC transporter substrate-binding protein [Nitrospirae bacterium]|nr:metal ABC transporter substrate-binding protein [Nitrospirota bacterium]
MKKLLLIFLVSFFPLQTISNEASAKLLVLSTYEHWADLAHQIGGDKIESRFLGKGYQNPHEISSTPAFVPLLNKADLLLVNGQELELNWLPQALILCRNERIQKGEHGYVDVSKDIPLLQYDQDDLKDSPFARLLVLLSAGKIGNHHYWMEPSNNLIMAKNIEEALEAADPANASVYQTNLKTFSDRFSQKIKEWDAMMVPYEGEKIVSYHRSWTYLARRYHWTIEDYVEPHETIPPSASYMAALVEKMKKENVKIILMENYQNLQIAKSTQDQR